MIDPDAVDQFGLPQPVVPRVENLAPEPADVPMPQRPFGDDIVNDYLDYTCRSLGVTHNGPVLLACTALASVLATRFLIDTGIPGHTLVPAIWGAVIAPPGGRKSPVFQRTVMPVVRLSRERNEAFRKAELELSTGIRNKKSRKASLIASSRNGDMLDAIDSSLADDEASLDKLVNTTFVVQNVTTEALNHLVSVNGGRAYAATDEGNAFLETATGVRYGGGGASSLSCLLTMFDGTTEEVTRIGRIGEGGRDGQLSIGICCQPSVWAAAMDMPGAVGQGFVQRFLITRQALTEPDMYLETPTHLKDHYEAVFRHLDALPVGEEPKLVPFAPDAKAKIHAFLRQCNISGRITDGTDGTPSQQFLLKLGTHTMRIAMALYAPILAQLVYAGRGHEAAIPLRCVDAAIGMALHFYHEMCRSSSKAEISQLDRQVEHLINGVVSKAAREGKDAIHYSTLARALGGKRFTRGMRGANQQREMVNATIEVLFERGILLGNRSYISGSGPKPPLRINPGFTPSN